jgi:class 3 adenylate cyclase/pimeloyl-ACP methyl ester carboxylesterase
MEPQYRFCTSSDGTRIAYATYGSGPPLLFVNTWVLSMDAQFTWPDARAFFDALADRAGLVILDRRGTGASQREVEDLSPEAETEDIAAVVEAAGLTEFPLFADATAGAAAACYASKYPERVQRLLLWAPHTSVPQEDSAQWVEVMRRDWSYWRRIWAGRIYPDGPVALQKAAGQALKQTVTAEMSARRMESHPDLRLLAPAVITPTLVLQREASPAITRQTAITIAGLLPKGELRSVPGYAPTPYPVHEAIVQTACQFFGIGTEATQPDAQSPSGTAQTGVTAQTGLTQTGTAVILFADIADSTALTERLGDAAFRAKARELGAALRSVIRESGGAPVEGPTLGDGLLATFSSARQAIEGALACARVGDEAGLPLHLGLHAGDVTREKDPDGRDNVYGGAVNIASRISGPSAPGEVLVSDIVRGLARTSAGVAFEDRGEQALKGVSEPVRVWAVVTEDQGAGIKDQG